MNILDRLISPLYRPAAIRSSLAIVAALLIILAMASNQAFFAFVGLVTLAVMMGRNCLDFYDHIHFGTWSGKAFALYVVSWLFFFWLYVPVLYVLLWRDIVREIRFASTILRLSLIHI